jgi:hypothetical protein
MSTKKSETLTEGDLIDLEPILEEFAPDDFDRIADISAFEYATVEEVILEPFWVLIVTDQHTMAVPYNYDFKKGD